MEIAELNPALLKQILRTSQGFPAQWIEAKAQVKPGQSGTKTVRATPAGHPISSHIRGADAIMKKTKFCSLDDQVAALWLLLNTPEGIQALKQLNPGVRDKPLKRKIDRLFPVQWAAPGRPGRIFTTAEQTDIGIVHTTCVAVLEGRERGGRLYLHIQTCYPKLEKTQIDMMSSRKPKR